MRDLPTLYALYRERQAERSGDNTRLIDLALIYDGGMITRIAEIDETAESAVPNLVAQGIDAYARASASVQPDIEFPPIRPNVAASRRRAGDRAKVVAGWWQGSLMPVLDYQRFRYYYGYGQMPVVIRPHPDAPGIPRWEARTPLGVLPGPRALGYSPEIPDCFTSLTRSAKWVTDNYGVTFGREVKPDTPLEVVEYIDAEQITCFCLGPSGSYEPTFTQAATATSTPGTYTGWSLSGVTRAERITGPTGEQGGWLVLLSSTPNYAEVCTVSAPGVISLSKVSGFVAGILSKHKLHARLMALTVKAITRGILPDEWLVGDPNGNGMNVVREADGLRGVRGQIEGAQVVIPQYTPSYQTMPLLDRMESYQREEAGIISEFGGASGSNIRTRARGESVAAMVVDPRVREAHEIAQVAREHEVKVAVAVAKGYGGGRTYSMYVSRNRQTARVEYRPDDVFENDQAMVRYALAGSDLQGLIIASGQSIGTGQMSKETGRALNPLVEDKAGEVTRIRTEALEDVALSSLQQLASVSPLDIAFILRRVREGALIEDVIEEANKRAQDRQASSGAPGEPTGPVEPGAPEAQPGLGAPGGPGQAPAAVPRPPASMRNLASLFVASRQPARRSEAEKVAG